MPWTETEIPPHSCPGCGHAIEVASSLTAEQAAAPGDYSVCLRCGSFLVFCEDMRTRLAALEEVATLNDDTRNELVRIRKGVAVVWLKDPQLRKLFHYEPYAEACLRAFAQELFRRSPDTEAMEGWDLEAMAVRHGLLQPVEVTEPCGTDCFCLKYGDGFPMTCNKRTAALTGKEV